MDKMSEKLIKEIEKALNIKFYKWQRKYLLNEPMLIDMRMTGRCTGKTFVYIIKKLFEYPEPLVLTRRTEVLKVADWWCCDNREDSALRNPYLDWYKQELKSIYDNLNKAGIITRKVVFH
ncbi:hypothetical protein [Clostridium beijerinckii]|uniref:Uncharacterized protein n=1 Tax=Clostridium beijerinckii TaxID=1520 RepID=A0AAW3W9E4_CLOBE|nr:hypothetical protein [Clostridium beijerinckii]MBC2456144.1 hypothetical protein [Clostridium beijerinckii]MBC2475429.1 hypothetical protein [Clostridium beijerinckii]NOV63462.1 hypothetical protein [Clostridium beijerinckii]NOV69572.1 hypothetical protein [Clostridium beijerinckii]NOW31519.1 hypothetical protein [Clostridium beijerinckii]